MSIQDLHLSEAGSRLSHGVRKFFGAILRRRKFNRLRDLDDHLLEDIGLTRHELEIATRLPFSRDASEEVRRLSLERRRERDSLLRTRFRF